jgi:RHS repeat-associated protein
MAGDRIDIFGRSYYFQNNSGGSSANANLPLTELLSNFLNSPLAAGVVNIKGTVTAGMINTPFGTSFITNLFNQQQNQLPSTKPKAYINYLFFDEQFKCVGGSSSPVGSNSELKQHFQDLQDLTVPQNGFVYIYCSNLSPVNVFFDNLQVVHTRGRILEETNYYPFGLTMAGISSKAANTLQNKIGITGKEMQNKEFSDGSGLEQYDFGARFYDPQIGRWHSQDRLADKWNSYSPYNYTLNNPINYVDPDGQDVRISAQQDKDGNWTITLSSTIYVTGHGASDRVGEYNKFLKDNPSLLKNTTKNEDGTTTSINLDFKYELATDEDIARVKDDKTRNGDNLLELENSEYQSASGGFRKDIYSKDKNPATGKWDKLGTEHFTDFKAKMGNSDKPDGRYYGSAPTAFHEVMHLFGLVDWYKSAEAKKAVGPNDMMNNSHSKQPIMHQTHWNSWGQDIKTRQQQQGNNFILNHFVE